MCSLDDSGGHGRLEEPGGDIDHQELGIWPEQSSSFAGGAERRHRLVEGKKLSDHQRTVRLRAGRLLGDHQHDIVADPAFAMAVEVHEHPPSSTVSRSAAPTCWAKLDRRSK